MNLWILSLSHLHAGDAIGKTQTSTPEGKSFTLLNLPYFLSGKIRAYLDWAIQE